jgi:acetyl esterase
MLHPQARALLRLMEERCVPPTHTLPPQEARRLYLERRAFTQPEPPAVAERRELLADGIALRLYRPLGAAAGDTLPALVYFHGGGWVIGDLDTHDTLCRELANGAGCAVISVDYRLAPEHRFPAAYDDALSATRWVCREASSLGIDARRIAIGGDSAGGNLAAAVAIACRDAAEEGDTTPAPAFQLLIYPATDQRRNQPSHQRNGQGYLLTSDTLRYFHDHYLPDPALDLDWRASPLLHENLAHLPPAFVLVAGYDPLHDEGAAYAQRLSEAGCHATLVNFERQIHGFILMGRVIDEANAAVQLCAAALRQALHRSL